MKNKTTNGNGKVHKLPNSLEAARYILKRVKEKGLAVVIARDLERFEAMDTTDGNVVEAYLKESLGPKAKRVEYEDDFGKQAMSIISNKMYDITGGIICTAQGRVTMEEGKKNITALLWGKPYTSSTRIFGGGYPVYESTNILSDSALDKINLDSNEI